MRTFCVSERRACRVTGQPRSTQRHQPRLPADEPRLLARMAKLVRAHPRYGYRRIWADLRREGWHVNRKRIYRLWKQEGYKVPHKVPQTHHKRRRLGTSKNSCTRRRPEYRHHIWAFDFIFDRDERGRSLKWLTVIDEYTRECLELLPARCLTSLDVIDRLIVLMRTHGAPAHIRGDNGPEFIARALRRWLERASVGTLYVQPGAPRENGYAESFQSRPRDELLSTESFANLREAQALAAIWIRDYNEARPHSSLGYLTPKEFAARQPHLPPGATPLAPGEAPSHDEQRTLIQAGT
jgi:putative transposase